MSDMIKSCAAGAILVAAGPKHPLINRIRDC